MLISGLQKLSLIDYPGKVSAIVFTKGCNFRCGFCHNPELVDPERFASDLDEDEVLAFLATRKGKLDAVTVTGGEPLLHPDIGEFLAKTKEMGFAVKLDSNGTMPSLLRPLLISGNVDYVAMDIKAPLYEYETVTGTKTDPDKIQASIRMIMESGLEYEFRSTVMPHFHDEEAIGKMATLVSGADSYYLQNFKNQGKVLDPDLRQERGFTTDELEALRKAAARHVKRCEIRD